jgi:hypothetical protein
MGEFDLNLSTRPFPAYRVTNLILIGILAVLILVSAWQTIGYLRFSSLSGEIRSQEEAALVESEALGRRLAAAEARLGRPESAAKLSEIGYLNGLITRKNFSWTRIFANLEDIVPGTVHLLNLTPEFAPDGTVLLRLNVRGRNIEEISRLIDTMENSETFKNVIVSVEEKRDPNAAAGVDVGLTVNYYPEKDAQ